MNNTLYTKYIKRLLDVVFSTILIILIFPFYLIVVLITWVDLLFCGGGSPIFIQKRVGKNNKIFNMLKLRSLPTTFPNYSIFEQIDKSQLKLSSWQKFIRVFSIDEIPQLINIWLGQMSFIGPRPCLETETELIKDRLNSGAMLCLPGLTGLAQVSGRTSLSVEQRATFDGEYAQKCSFILDMKIILKTFIVVITRDGASKVDSNKNDK